MVGQDIGLGMTPFHRSSFIFISVADSIVSLVVGCIPGFVFKLIVPLDSLGLYYTDLILFTLQDVVAS